MLGFMDAGICSKDEVGSKAGIGLDAAIRGNNSSGNPTKTMYPVMIDNITTALITIFYLSF